MRPAQVPREDEAPLHPLFLQIELQDRGTEDVTGVPKRDGHALADRDSLVVRMPVEQPDRGLGVLGRIERLPDLRAATAGVLVDELRVLELDVGAVAQHDPAEIGRGGRRMNRSPITQSRQRGKVATVIDVRVGQDDGVDRRRIEGQFAVDPLAQVALALIEPAVEKHAALPDRQQVP